MTKGAKSTATIRRRKLKYTQSDLERVRGSRPPTTQNVEPVDDEDDGYLFDEEVLGPSIVQKIMSSDKSLLWALISLRVVNSLVIQTQFVPDEFWQSLEVSHNMAFGYGHLTWEWHHGLRGYLYPSIFALLYKCLAIVGLDYRLLLIKLPRIVQGVIAAYGDLYLYKLSRLLCDRGTAQWSLLCQTVSWFMLYCSTRTLTNSTETALVTIALYYYPWPTKNSGSAVKFLSFAAASILMRPTAAVIWVLLCSWHLQQNTNKLYKTLKVYAAVGVGSLSFSAVIDRIFYGKWICVQYNFLEFNVFSGIGEIYGTHPWHWYITQGYPVVMATHLFPFILGAWKAKNKVLLLIIIWTIFVYSFLPHKEFRFLMPVLPLSFHYCGVYFQSLCKKPRMKRKPARQTHLAGQTANHHGSQESLLSTVDGTESTASTTTEISTDTSKPSSDNVSAATDTSVRSDEKLTNSSAGQESGNADNASKTLTANSEASEDSGDTTLSQELVDAGKKRDLSTNELVAELERKQRETHKVNLTKAKVFVIFLLLFNIPTALYFSLIHQRGTVLVMKHLHDVSQERKVDILFLMPCHSTPYYSYLHKNVSMRFLTCEPNLSRVENYTDEADVFYENPIAWLKREYSGSPRPWPSHIVSFSNLQKEVDSYLSQSGYRQCASFFHTHLPEGRVGTHVTVSCR